MPIYEYKCDICGKVFTLREEFAKQRKVVLHTELGVYCAGTGHLGFSTFTFEIK